MGLLMSLGSLECYKRKCVMIRHKRLRKPLRIQKDCLRLRIGASSSIRWMQRQIGTDIGLLWQMSLKFKGISQVKGNLALRTLSQRHLEYMLQRCLSLRAFSHQQMMLISKKTCSKSLTSSLSRCAKNKRPSLGQIPQKSFLLQECKALSTRRHSLQSNHHQ